MTEKQKKIKVFCNHCGADTSIIIQYLVDYGGSISGNQVCWYCSKSFKWYVRKKDL